MLLVLSLTLRVSILLLLEPHGVLDEARQAFTSVRLLLRELIARRVLFEVAFETIRLVSVGAFETEVGLAFHLVRAVRVRALGGTRWALRVRGLAALPGSRSVPLGRGRRPRFGW